MFGSNVDVGKGIADLLVTNLVKDGTYSLIERKALDKIMAEQNFSNSNRAAFKHQPLPITWRIFRRSGSKSQTPPVSVSSARKVSSSNLGSISSRDCANLKDVETLFTTSISFKRLDVSSKSLARSAARPTSRPIASTRAVSSVVH